MWTITPYYGTNHSVFRIEYGDEYGGAVHYHSSTIDKYNVSPVIYLKSNVKIISGNGSETNPYQLSM